MYDDYDFNQEDDFQMLVEGRCSDDEEFFKNNKSISKHQSRKSTSKLKKSSSYKKINDRNQIFIDEDSNSSSLSTISRNKYDETKNGLNKYGDDNEKFSDDDPINPFDEAEEEVIKEQKNKSKETEDGVEKYKRKNIIRNPRVILNDEKLKSTDGIVKLPELFQNIKFKGKNYEKDDLNSIMSIYQNWSHRLMPSLQFDDFIEKAENLCRNAKMKVFLTKIRQGMPLDIRDNQSQNDKITNQYNDIQDDDPNEASAFLPKINMEDEFIDNDLIIDDEDNKINDEYFETDKTNEEEYQEKQKNEECDELIEKQEEFCQANNEALIDKKTEENDLEKEIHEDISFNQSFDNEKKLMISDKENQTK